MGSVPFCCINNGQDNEEIRRGVVWWVGGVCVWWGGVGGGKTVVRALTRRCLRWQRRGEDRWTSREGEEIGGMVRIGRTEISLRLRLGSISGMVEFQINRTMNADSG